MLFNEWIKDNSLFTEINTIKPSTFITNYGADKLDLIYKMRYGVKTIPSYMENLTVTDVANAIVISYGEQWNSKYTLLHDEILLGVESKVIVEETVNDDIIKISNSNSENKVSAYNEEELTTNDSDANIINDDMQKESNRNTVTTRTNLNAIKIQLELFNSNFIDIVCEDVKKIVALSIY